MSALSKLLLLLAVFQSATNANAFTNLSPVTGNFVQVNHLIRFDESITNPKNKPSCEPMCEPTNDSMVNDQTTNQILEWDAELPNILSPKRGKYSIIAILITQNTSNISYKFEKVNGINTSYTFEAVNGVNAKPFETVNGVNHNHDKIKVGKRVTFSDERDSEILSESPVQYNSQSNDSNGL